MNETLKQIGKSKKCSECQDGFTKRIKRKNYPFGRKSKPIKSVWNVCQKCGHSELVNDGRK